ncbi:TPA: DUF1642 domain-containing protein [Enterococcus faecium]
MNKQELIERYKIKYAEEPKDWKHPSVNASRQDLFANFIRDLEQLDEPQKPVVPKCFDIDYKKYKYMENNKAEILLTAMGGIYRVSFPNSFKDDLEANAWKTGIKWNNWTKETILWASRNYADFCQAVISGEYEVEKDPLYRVKIGEGYFVEYQGRGALIMPDCNKEIKIFDSKSDAERTAQTIGGTVEEVAEG